MCIVTSWIISLGVTGINYSDTHGDRFWARLFLLALPFGPLVACGLIGWGIAIVTGGMASGLKKTWIAADVRLPRIRLPAKTPPSTGELSYPEDERSS